MLGVVFVVFVKAFLEGVVDGVDSGFAGFVAIESINVGFLNEKDNEKE